MLRRRSADVIMGWIGDPEPVSSSTD